MYCYNCTESTDVSTKTVSTTNVSEEPISQYAKKGNGYAKITYLGTSSVYYNNFSKNSSSVDVENLIIDNSKSEVSFHTSLSNLEDYMEFSIDLTNFSDKDMYISKVLKSNYDNSKVSYTIQYNDGMSVNERDIIHGNSTETIFIRVQLLDDSVKLTNEYFSLQLKYDEAKDTETYGRESWSFDYTGGEQEFTVPAAGTYKLEVWGAQGGTSYNGSSTVRGGYGAYSVGLVSLTTDDDLYINVGGRGNDCRVVSTGTRFSGGYNGGGFGYEASSDVRAAGGGGATHIALKSGLLSQLSNDISDILIVSGGGAGAYIYNGGSFNGHSGGGYIGGYKGTSTSYSGTQTTGASFGLATDNDNSYTTNTNHSGGGGGYYGGIARWDGYAGGGSGYIGNEKLSDKVMYCFSCQEPATTDENYENIKTITTTNVSESAVSKYAKSGAGYAKITYISK